MIGLDDLTPPQSQVERHAVPTDPATGTGAPRTAGLSAVLTGGPQPCADALKTQTEYESGYTADQIASAYSLSGYYAAGNLGAGQTIALLEEEPYLPADIEQFQKCYGTHTTVEPVNISGGPGPYKPKDGGESELDIDQLIGLAPEAKIVVYQGPNESGTTTQILSTWITENRAKVMSSSWGLCEKETDPAEYSAVGTLLQEAAAQGQSFFVAAGDDGATDCYETDGTNKDKDVTVDYPGSDPFATDVGGTRLEQPTTPPVQYIWNDGPTEGGAGGGGVSAHWGMPSYQSSALASLNVISQLAAGTACGLPGPCREVPDVSAEADPDTSYVVFTEQQWGETGGTSAAAPLWAAFATLANASPACGGKAIGFANPALYSIGGTAYEGNFDDVVSARPGGLKSNDLFDETKPFFPGPRYDMATGIGTPVGTTLGDSLCAIVNPPAPPPPPTPTPAPAPTTSPSKPSAAPAPAPTPAKLKAARLGGVAKGAPKLTLGLEARQGATLEAVTIVLPPGLEAAKAQEGPGGRHRRPHRRQARQGRRPPGRQTDPDHPPLPQPRRLPPDQGPGPDRLGEAAGTGQGGSDEEAGPGRHHPRKRRPELTVPVDLGALSSRRSRPVEAGARGKGRKAVSASTAVSVTALAGCDRARDGRGMKGVKDLRRRCGRRRGR